MNKVELIHFSLASAFEILESLVGDLTQEQADWMPPGTANPIGVLYWHTISYVDQIVHEWCMPPYKDMTFEEWSKARGAGRDLDMGQVPLRYSARWRDKVVIAFPPENPEDPYWEVRAVREGLRLDLAALHDYDYAVKQTLLSWVASLTPDDLERSIPTPIGEFNMGQLLESFIIGHINNHSGEISALKGCQGIQGYPW